MIITRYPPPDRDLWLETAGYRAVAGETLAYFHQLVLEEHGDTATVLAMGISTTRHSTPQVRRSPTPRLWNIGWDQLGSTEGTFYFSGEASLFDQFLRYLAESPERRHPVRGRVL